jgi:hypothetical protein
MFKKFVLYIQRFFVPVSGSNELARYLTSHSHFSIEKKIVKPNAFMPMLNLQKNMLETSVFKINKLKNDEIWRLGIDHVIGKTDKTLYGRAELKGENVQGFGLVVEVDDNPPRHGTINGWPEKKSEQKLLAIKLASASTIYLKS